MAIDPDALAEVLALAQGCEDVARAALGVGQRLLRDKAITQDTFDKVFQDYSTAMQKARDMYYQASHGLAQDIASAADLKELVAQTAALHRSLARLEKTEHVLTISFSVVTAVAAFAGAVITPSAVTVAAAYAAAKSLKQTIGG